MIPTDWSNVESSNIAAVRFDAGAGELQIRFKNGRSYAYQGVPPEEAEAIYHASSPGQYFRENIMGAYSERRI